MHQLKCAIRVTNGTIMKWKSGFWVQAEKVNAGIMFLLFFPVCVWVGGGGGPFFLVRPSTPLARWAELVSYRSVCRTNFTTCTYSRTLPREERGVT